MPFELLFRDVNSLIFSSFDKECIKDTLRDCASSPFKQVSKISDKNLPDEEIKALKNLSENKNFPIISSVCEKVWFTINGLSKMLFHFIAFYIFPNFKWLLSNSYGKTILIYNGFRGF